MKGVENMYTEKAYHFVIGETTGIELMVLAKSYEEAMVKIERDLAMCGLPMPTIYRWYTTD